MSADALAEEIREEMASFHENLEKVLVKKRTKEEEQQSRNFRIKESTVVSCSRVQEVLAEKVGDGIERAAEELVAEVKEKSWKEFIRGSALHMPRVREEDLLVGCLEALHCKVSEFFKRSLIPKRLKQEVQEISEARESDYPTWKDFCRLNGKDLKSQVDEERTRREKEEGEAVESLKRSLENLLSKRREEMRGRLRELEQRLQMSKEKLDVLEEAAKKKGGEGNREVDEILAKEGETNPQFLTLLKYSKVEESRKLGANEPLQDLSPRSEPLDSEEAWEARCVEKLLRWRRPEPEAVEQEGPGREGGEEKPNEENRPPSILAKDTRTFSLKHLASISENAEANIMARIRIMAKKKGLLKTDTEGMKDEETLRKAIEKCMEKSKGVKIPSRDISPQRRKVRALRLAALKRLTDLKRRVAEDMSEKARKVEEIHRKVCHASLQNLLNSSGVVRAVEENMQKRKGSTLLTVAGRFEAEGTDDEVGDVLLTLGPSFTAASAELLNFLKSSSTS